jgi:hypothetical protein
MMIMIMVQLAGTGACSGIQLCLLYANVTDTGQAEIGEIRTKGIYFYKTVT